MNKFRINASRIHRPRIKDGAKAEWDDAFVIFYPWVYICCYLSSY